MSSQKKTPQISALDYLPSEVLITVLQNLDVQTLRTIVKIYRRSRLLFSDYHTQILTQILTCTLSDPAFHTYFPISHKGIAYPFPSNLTPLETSHTSAFTHIRWAKSLVALERSVSALTAHVASIVTEPLLPEFFMEGTYTGPASLSSSHPVIVILTATIHRSVIINAQISFYAQPPYTATTEVDLPPRPDISHLEYPASIALRLLPSKDFQQFSNITGPITSDIIPLKDIDEDALVGCLSDPFHPDHHRIIHKIQQTLWGLIFHAVAVHLIKYKIWRENCLLPEFKYRHDSRLVRDITIFYRFVHPDTLLQVLRQCVIEDNYDNLREENAHRIKHWEAREQKRYNKIAADLGVAYKKVCHVAHVYLRAKAELDAALSR
ncbi:hypothetical protein ABW20_dc0106162 [Dactylellina cionopaga]|nr:hypothetical protein ABW20_dc0106162 [Dactylellina cionopaga]